MLGRGYRLDADVVVLAKIEPTRVLVRFADGAELWVSDFQALTIDGAGGISAS